MNNRGLVTTASELRSVCSAIREAGIVAMDTEFVSENTYRPELCLLQLALPGDVLAIDPFEIADLSDWWEIMADDQVTVVVHAARQEVRFCLDATRQRPGRLWDVQIAEGLRSRSFPLNHERLVSRVLGKKVSGTQSRTDWKRRPLADRQIDYALDDVRFLLEVWKRQRDSLAALGRLGWAEAEFLRMMDDVEAERSAESWRKLPGLNKLDRRGLAVARALYFWREDCAEELDQPVRRVVRDDLLLDLARRQPRTHQDVLATRDMNRRNFKRHAEKLSEVIDEVFALPESEYPKREKRRGEVHDDEHVLSQLLAIALANRCADLDVATSLVGTSADLKHLVRWHVYGDREGDPPRICQAWRAEVCGDLLTDVLDGKIAIRVSGADAATPLLFEDRDRREMSAAEDMPDDDDPPEAEAPPATDEAPFGYGVS